MEQPHSQTVIVVNDDPVQLRMLAGILEKDGLQVLGCGSAEEGLSLMQARGAPDALVTDLHMPNIDGWRFCRLLRSPEYAPFNELPILVVSATFAGDHAQEITRDLGANAFLSLPCQAQELRQCVQDLLAGKTPQVHPKVLIIEDHPTLASLLEQALTDHGYLADSVLTGEDGRRRFQELTPDLVIMDYHLPNLSGDTLLKEFKQAAWSPAVIMITGDITPTLAVRFLRLGANGYVRKPFDPCFLVELCHQVHKERALIRVEAILEARTQELRDSHARLQDSEAQFRESEEKYRLLVANLPALVFTGYADCSVDFYDDKIEKLTGFSREEFADRSLTWRQMILPEDWPMVRQVFIQALKGDQKYVREYRIRTRGGDILWIQERSQIILQPDGATAYISGIFFDISERKRLEEEHFRLEKLESLGVLAGGIAHDFNNLLTAILGNVNLAALTPPLPQPVVEHLSSAEQACARAQALAQQLLTFARGGAPLKKVATLTPLIQEAANLALAGSGCRAELSLPEDLWSAEVDAGQISQALHNILINADQAMPGGGAIAVMAENLRHKDKAGQAELPLPSGPYVKISVRDQGTGVAPENLGKIFDPYFSTKQKGRGLELATAFSIVKKHGGHLLAASTPGRGTTFTLYLPAARHHPAQELEAKTELTSGRGRILVMDDEPLVREIASRMLQHLGYEVEDAPDGDVALEKYRQAQTEDRPFDAVILDLTVPGGLGGKETLEILRGLDPQVRAIVSSGYADNLIMTQFAAHGFQGVIKKPYRLTDFSQALHKALRSHAKALPAGYRA